MDGPILELTALSGLDMQQTIIRTKAQLSLSLKIRAVNQNVLELSDTPLYMHRRYVE